MRAPTSKPSRFNPRNTTPLTKGLQKQDCMTSSLVIARTKACPSDIGRMRLIRT